MLGPPMLYYCTSVMHSIQCILDGIRTAMLKDCGGFVLLSRHAGIE